MHPAIDHLKTSISQAQTDRNNLLRNITEDSRQLLPLLISEIFNSNPGLELVAWTQFEGEYNDEGPYPGIEPMVVRAAGEVSDEYSGIGNLNNATASTVLNQVRTALSCIPDEAAFSLFGTYNWVIATRAGIETLNEYDLYDYNIDWDEVYNSRVAP